MDAWMETWLTDRFGDARVRAGLASDGRLACAVIDT